MLLYYCPECGRWSDMSLAKILNDTVENLRRSLKQEPTEELGYPCPAGHGIMKQVMSTDRIALRLAVVHGSEQVE